MKTAEHHKPYCSSTVSIEGITTYTTVCSRQLLTTSTDCDHSCCCGGHQKDHQVGTKYQCVWDLWTASVSSCSSSMQVIRCALFVLVSVPVSSVSVADSCPAVCECSEWRAHTIYCYDIDILPRFPASTEKL